VVSGTGLATTAVGCLMGVVYVSHWADVAKVLLIGLPMVGGLLLIAWGAGRGTFLGRRRHALRSCEALLRLPDHPEKFSRLDAWTTETFLWLNESRRPGRAMGFHEASRHAATPAQQAERQMDELRAMRWLRRDRPTP
jgi:hypothetical protein